MRPQRALLQLPAAEGIRLVALKLLGDARKTAAKLTRDPSAENLHAFRVALRRLHTWLRAFKRELRGVVYKKDRDALRTIARATNPKRDVDVQLDLLERTSIDLRRKRRRGADWMTKYLKRRRREASSLDTALPRRFTRVASELENRLASRSAREKRNKTLGVAVASQIPEHVDDLDTELAKVRSLKDWEPAHKARIATKRLRYLLEPTAPFAKRGNDVLDSLKSLQHELGTLHDSHVIGREIDVVIDEAANAPRKGLLGVADHVQKSSEEEFVSVRKHWLGSRRKRLKKDVLSFSKRLRKAPTR